MQTTCSRCGLFHPAEAACPLSALLGPAPTGVRQPGELIAGRYRVARVLHHGGMSTVYLAVDTLLDSREVAIKELRPAADATPEEVREAEAWFARESALLSALHHPLIPLFYSVFRDEDRSYIVQEYVPGTNLEEMVAEQGPVSEQTAIEWGIALCDLLTYLHGRAEPVIFRDLKPANVLVRAGPGQDRQLAVVDFGIARRFQHDTVGTVIGTPGYAPPEQYQGLATPESDIYALGATLHRLLTSYDPEHPGPAQPLFTFPPAGQLNPAISPRMEQVLARATALAPADRFATAAEMRAALKGLATRRLKVADPTRPSSSRHALVVMAAVLLFPLMLTQMLRIARLPLQNDFYAASSNLEYPGNSQPVLGAPNGNDGNPVFATITACSAPTSLGDVQTGTSVCGPDGTFWQINWQQSAVDYTPLSGPSGSYTTIDFLPADAQLVSLPRQISHCNCVWLLGDNAQVRLDADGNWSTQPLPASVIPQVQSGLLQP